MLYEAFPMAYLTEQVSLRILTQLCLQFPSTSDLKARPYRSMSSSLFLPLAPSYPFFPHSGPLIPGHSVNHVRAALIELVPQEQSRDHRVG